MPKVSVIIPVYNAEKYLKAALDSVLRQKGVEIEIIAVDDGSTDRSPEILSLYAEKHKEIKIIHVPNGGVGRARNIGLSHVTGEWIAFCDSDDIVPDNSYTFFLRQIAEADVVVGNFVDITDNKQKRESQIQYFQGASPFRQLFVVPCLWNKFIRTSFIQQNGLAFEEEMKIGEDAVFLGQLLTCRPRIKIIKDCVYEHWFHDKDPQKSLIHFYDLKHFQLHMKTRYRLLEIYTENHFVEGERYVYEDLTPFLTDFLFRMWSREEQCQAFFQLQEFIKGYNWSDKPEIFKSLFLVTVDEFANMTAEKYLTQLPEILPREQVLLEFKAGQIGLRYLIKYLKAWFAYKRKGLITR